MELNDDLTLSDFPGIPQWLCGALDAASCGIVVADATQPDMPVIYVNRTFEAITGYPAAEVLGRNCRFLQGPERDQPGLAEVRRALAEQRVTRVILRNYRKDGTWFWNAMQLAPVFNGEGQLTHYVGVQTDVTAQREAEMERERTARRFSECLEAIPFGVLVIDREGRIFFANRAAGQITGKVFEAGAMIGNLAELCQATVAGTDRPYALEAMPIMRALAGEATTASDMVIRRGGQSIPLKVSAAPIHDLDGRIVLAIAVFTDITELRDSVDRLATEEARHRALLNSAIDAILAIDTSGTILSANPATERMFGYAPAELLGHNVRMLMPEPHHSQHDQYIRNYLDTGQAKVIGLGRETVARRKDGSEFPIDLAVTEVRTPSGLLFKGIIRDISERKATEALIHRTLSELKKSEQDLLTLLNEVQMGSLIVGSDGRVEFVSDACTSFAGIDRTKSLGQPWDTVIPGGTEPKSKLRRLLSAPDANRTRVSLHWKGDDHKHYWVECDVRDDPKDPLRRIMMLYDVTEIHQLREAIERSRYGRLLGKSPAMRDLFRLIRDVARGDWTVLIEGETGTGKELVAHSIHAASGRKDGPFIAVNAAGLSESLLTSQLFGHRKGAFTGAFADQQGFFEAAQGGTLFLDEIGDLPLNMQASLLRVLQESEITRVGETRARKVDVRVLAATHKDLSSEVRAGTFRADLLYRLRVARLFVPPLRQRRDDIPLLIEWFLGQTYQISGKSRPRFGETAMRCLLGYGWPGNVRELKACIDYAVIHCRGDEVRPTELPPEIGYSHPDRPAPMPTAASAENEERARILAALEETGGNRLRAAKLLGMSRATFYRRLAELAISLP